MGRILFRIIFRIRGTSIAFSYSAAAQVLQNAQCNVSPAVFLNIELSAAIMGTSEKEDTAEVIAMIKASRADIVLVAMGNPRQERWLAENLRSTGARLGFAVGALFDFASGNARRAPAWMRSARLEWLYRLTQEPRRLCGRYLVGNPLFVLRVLAQRFSGARRGTVNVTLR